MPRGIPNNRIERKENTSELRTMARTMLHKYYDAKRDALSAKFEMWHKELDSLNREYKDAIKVIGKAPRRASQKRVKPMAKKRHVKGKEAS